MLLQRDQRINGIEVFKTGGDLKKGLIDIDKVYELVKAKQGDEAQSVSSRQQKWKAVMAFMA